MMEEEDNMSVCLRESRDSNPSEGEDDSRTSDEEYSNKDDEVAVEKQRKEYEEDEDDETEVHLDDQGRFTMPLPPDDGDDHNEQISESSEESESYNEYIQHIKIRKKYKGTRGHQPNYFECLQEVFELLERYSKGRFELVPFDEKDIGRGLKQGKNSAN